MNKHSCIYCICIWHTHIHKHACCHLWATSCFLWFKDSSLVLSKVRFRKEVVNQTSSTYTKPTRGRKWLRTRVKQNISQRDAINCHTFTDRGEQVGSVGSGQKTTWLLLCTRAPSKACVGTARPSSAQLITESSQLSSAFLQLPPSCKRAQTTLPYRMKTRGSISMISA
jgi:hypothetical protein